VVREVGGWDEVLAFAALEALLDRRLVRDAESRGQFDYAFTHHLIQAALYAEIPAARCQRRHLRVAHVLADLYPGQKDERAGELAYHYDQGGDAASAIPHYLAAARQHLAVWADAEAQAVLDRALTLADEDPSRATPRLVFGLLLLRENILHRRGERALQRADLERLAQIAQTLGDERLRCEVWRRQAIYHSILGERSAEADRIQRLKAGADRLADPRWQAQARLAEGRYHALVSDYALAQASLEQALTLYQAAGDEAGPVACYCALADVAVQQGYFTEAQGSLAEAHRRAAAQSNQSLLVQTMRTAGGAMFARQDFSATEALGHQMLDLCRVIGDREGEADALARLAAVAARLFRVEDARSHYAAAGQLYGAIGKRQGQAAVLVNTVMLLVGRLGRYREGLALTRQAEPIFRSLGDVRGQAICALNEGMIALYLEDYVASRDASQRGLELARQMDSRVMEANALANLGAAERELGELDDAIAHMEAGLTIRRALGQPAELGTDLCDLTVAYCRRGDLAAAQAAADEMLALYAQAEASMMHPQYMLWAAAQTGHALGEEARARELVDQAHDVMRQRATAIPDPESHASFHDLPFNRQISAAHERGEWP
ncbi:MAG: hypothetical protein KJ734_09165, partial [Chloroflexi bacterium]|nr:hypothetical protein [Chloroflexota bacterium]